MHFRDDEVSKLQTPALRVALSLLKSKKQTEEEVQQLPSGLGVKTAVKMPLSSDPRWVPWKWWQFFSFNI